MAIQGQEGLDFFFLFSSPEVNSQATCHIGAETALEEDLALPVLLFETNKELFDLALKNGFRLLGVG